MTTASSASSTKPLSRSHWRKAAGNSPDLLDALVFTELIEGNYLDSVHDTVDGLVNHHDTGFVVIQATVFPPRHLNFRLTCGI